MQKASGAPSRVARRRFLRTVPAAVAAAVVAPTIAQQAQEAQRINKETLDCAEKIIGIDFPDADQQQAVSGVNTNLANFERLRATTIPSTSNPRSRSVRTFPARNPSRAPRPTPR